MTRLEHKERIKKQREAYDRAHQSMLKIWNMKDHFNKGSIFSKGLEGLEAERRYIHIKTDLEHFLQEAIDDGFPELVI